MSGLRVGRCLKWTTNVVDGTRSSAFRVGNCELYLRIAINQNRNYNDCYIYIYPKPIKDTSFRPFNLKCFFEKTTSKRPYGLLLKHINSQGEFSLWYFQKETLNEIMREKIMFVFVFDEDISLELRTESGEETAVSDLSSLSSDLGALLASGDSTDVKLKTESGIRSAHRSVLACRSEVFSAMFRNEMKESTSGLVEIKDLDGTVFDHFLGYMYTGRLPVNLGVDTLVQLYSAADKYAVNCMKKHCGYILSRCVTKENHQELLLLADTHSDETLKKGVIEAIVPNWVKCEGWQQFSKEHQALAIEVFFNVFNKEFKE